MCIYICLCLEIIDRIEEYICMYIYRRICTCLYYMYIASEQRMHLGSQFNFFPAGPVHVDGVLSLFSIFFFFLNFDFFFVWKGSYRKRPKYSVQLFWSFFFSLAFTLFPSIVGKSNTN